mmetsp:Transcript_39286/g.76254  ORF Transcript_39286/g.76254 Transcript_39286/m.76254 type:complete len:101 (-) Transcript_39286:289-591(-)
MEFDEEADLCLKGGRVTHAKFEDYDRAVAAAEYYRKATNVMFYVFWALFFTMVLVVFLYYDTQDFKVDGAAWHGCTAVVCGAVAIVYLLYRLFDCLAYVF